MRLPVKAFLNFTMFDQSKCITFFIWGVGYFELCIIIIVDLQSDVSMKHFQLVYAFV